MGCLLIIQVWWKGICLLYIWTMDCRLILGCAGMAVARSYNWCWQTRNSCSQNSQPMESRLHSCSMLTKPDCHHLAPKRDIQSLQDVRIYLRKLGTEKELVEALLSVGCPLFVITIPQFFQYLLLSSRLMKQKKTRGSSILSRLSRLCGISHFKGSLSPLSFTCRQAVQWYAVME